MLLCNYVIDNIMTANNNLYKTVIDKCRCILNNILFVTGREVHFTSRMMIQIIFAGLMNNELNYIFIFHSTHLYIM